ncbi:MAG: alpha/beta hydrolase [Rhodothalassiaceae bacterium]
MVKRLVIGLALLLVLTGSGLYAAHTYYRGQIFNPSSEVADPAKASYPIEVVQVPLANGIGLNAWWHAPGPGERTILYLHGNASNVAGYVRGTAPLVEAGYGLLIIDYRGFGGNPGRPSDEKMLEDGRAALRWLETQGVSSNGVILYGYSLGTGVAVPLAAEEQVAGLVLAAPFGSIAQMGYERMPRWLVDLLLSDRFDSLAAAPSVDEPVLIFHGTADEVVPARFSESLAAALPRAQRVIVHGAGHGWDLFETGGHEAAFQFMAGLAQ